MLLLQAVWGPEEGVHRERPAQCVTYATVLFTSYHTWSSAAGRGWGAENHASINVSCEDELLATVVGSFLFLQPDSMPSWFHP